MRKQFRKTFSKEEAVSGRRSQKRNQIREDVLERGSGSRKTFSDEEAGSGRGFRIRKLVWFRKTFSKKEAGLGLGRRSQRKKQV